jgi:GntR family transcriptional regulator
MPPKKPPTALTDNRLPRYLQIRDELMRRICARAWTAGEALPAEDKLAAEFAVSLGTLRKAMGVLVDDGMVERIHGRGTFVTRAFERISLLRFVGFSLEKDKMLPQTATLDIQVRNSPMSARKKLGLTSKEKILYLHRTRSIGGTVLLSEHIYLPHQKFSRLEAYLKKNSPPLLYPVYDSLCGVLISRAADELSVCPLPDADAALLAQRQNALGVRIERTMEDHTGQPIEWRICFVAADRFHYVVENR